MLQFTLWSKAGANPRLYISPNTPGKAFVFLSSGDSGSIKVFSNDAAEQIQLQTTLQRSGVGFHVPFGTMQDLIANLTQCGHALSKPGFESRKKTPTRAAAKNTKADYANTDTPEKIHIETLKYSLSSIKFNRGTERFTITIDTREPEELARRIERSGITTVSSKLDVGDIRISSNDTGDELIIERKTVSDLYSSIVSNSAHRQAECLFEYQVEKAKAGSRVMVVWLIEGELSGQRMLYNAFPGSSQTDGVINFLTGILGQHVLQCYNQHHLAYMTVKLAQGFFESELVYKVNAKERKSRTEQENRTALISNKQGEYHGVRTQDKNPLMQILMAIPSLKEPVAKAIISKGHRFADVLAYTESDWQSYEGVGKVLSNRLLQEVKAI
ncbi:ERCC4 domain-containing protein [Rheinheimera sp.]|uniref:ERCC4 domain-containing protein n=1 Tax=Rheinheimera sp. TaxID=1869214 RepID=UPI004047BE87